jgi:two-component system sensor histidine kinase BarA
MSYRTIKRLFGETSLERKTRFFLGGALLVLISGSFYFYAQLNLGVIRDQFRQRAQLLIAHNLQTIHWQHNAINEVDAEFGTESEQSPTGKYIGALSRDLKPKALREDNWNILLSDSNAPGQRRPSTTQEFAAVAEVERQLGANREKLEDPLFKLPYVISANPATGEEQYFQAILARKNCLTCHRKTRPDLAENDLLGVGKVTFQLKETEGDIARNNAVLITLAIVTSTLAMIATYAIVRYVIVRPVQHLKEVSDSIAHGDLDQRADIRTGDEFEELSHAFNRMLRHLVTTQDELKQVNSNLDHKVDELAQANLSLHEMNKLRNEFLATMTHELRTPLNSILGFSDILEGARNLEDKQRKYLNNIQISGRTLLTLVNDILDLAKMEAGKMQLHINEFVVVDLVDRVVATLLPLAERKNISLDSEVDPAIPLVRQDNGKIQQILVNLLSNAVKFTPEGGRIRITARRHGESEFDLIVSDTGIGIPLEDQSMIFDKFRQGRSLPGQDNSLTREYEGTGLGLSIVKELCKLLRGDIFLESEFGKGSTFTVRLPIEIDIPLAARVEFDPKATLAPT